MAAHIEPREAEREFLIHSVSTCDGYSLIADGVKQGAHVLANHLKRV